MKWELKKALLLGLLDKCAISLDEILVTPEKQDQTAIFYCPFCSAEYIEKRHNCIDCGLDLIKFEKGEKRCRWEKEIEECGLQ